MATVYLEGTEFSFSILPLKLFSKVEWANTIISIKNEYVSYDNQGKYIGREELDEWISAMFRLLAGAYGKEYSLSFERAGIAVDFYPYTKDGMEATRYERRANDCVMAIRLLMRSSDQKRLLGGVYSLLLHREEIEKFAESLRAEFDIVFSKLGHGRGEYLFVGVSPLGYKGCNYWYLDPSKSVQPGDYVWVKMGRHQLEQIVHVDSIRYFNGDNAPYDPLRVKQVLRKATVEELEKE